MLGVVLRPRSLASTSGSCHPLGVARTPSEGQGRRNRWLRTHRIWASLLIGTVWAILCALITMFIFGWDPVSLIFWLAAGWLLFGPLMTTGMVRSAAKEEP